jgi:hypothetical protein
VRRRVYDADGRLLYDNVWRSYYRSEPKLVRVGAKPQEKPKPKPATTGATTTTAATTPSAQPPPH